MIARLKAKKLPGFTLLELVVVIVIIAILSAIAIPAFSSVINKSKDASAMATLAAVTRDAEAIYTLDQGSTDIAWYSSYSQAVAETPAASGSAILAAQGHLTLKLSLPYLSSDDVAASAALAASVSGVPEVGISADPTQLTIAASSGAVGMALKSKSGNCVMGLKSANNEVSTWSQGRDTGANCSASIAINGQSQAQSQANINNPPASSYGAPSTTLAVANNYPRTLTLSWPAIPAASGDHTSYSAFVRDPLAADPSNWVAFYNDSNVQTTPTISVNFTSTVAQVGHPLDFKVQGYSYNTSVASTFSNTVTLTPADDVSDVPPALTGFTVVGHTDGTTTLSWDPIVNATGHSATGVLIWEGSQADCSATAGNIYATTSPVEMPWNGVTGLQDFNIRVLNNFAAGPTTTKRSDLGVVPDLGTPTASVASDGVHLSWQQAVDPLAGPTPTLGYRLYRSLNTDPAVPVLLNQAIGVDSTSFLDSTAAAGQSYLYWIHYYGTYGESPAQSAAGVRVVMPPVDGTVGTPSLVSGGVSFALNFTSTTLAPFNSYYIARSAPLLPTPEWVVLDSHYAGSATSYTDTTAAYGVSYVYYVKAFDDASGLESTLIPSTMVTTPTPMSVATASATDSHVSLSWAKADNGSGYSVDGYRVYRSANSGAYTLLTQVVGSTNLTYSDDSAVNGVPYSYRLSYFGTFGETPLVNSSPSVISPTGTPPAITGMSVTSMGPITNNPNYAGMYWYKMSWDQVTMPTNIYNDPQRYKLWLRSVDPSNEWAGFAYDPALGTTCDAADINGPCNDGTGRVAYKVFGDATAPAWPIFIAAMNLRTGAVGPATQAQ